MSRRDRTLMKDSREGMIGGVCAGVADYFELDVKLVRAVFVAATVISGFGAILYLLLWIMLDDAQPPPPAPPLDVGIATDTLADTALDTAPAGAPTPEPPTAEVDPAVTAPIDSPAETTWPDR